ncbi:MAG: PEP-CTERM sorting domain-containing protein [Sphingomonas sp.]|nr:MAG: PEP-CTERM sorting domain-containing protein [Sphingomonas sp.]
MSSVPEPSTWAMLLGGFMVIGMALRQRRRGATRLA